MSLQNVSALKLLFSGSTIDRFKQQYLDTFKFYIILLTLMLYQM